MVSHHNNISTISKVVTLTSGRAVDTLRDYITHTSQMVISTRYILSPDNVWRKYLWRPKKTVLYFFFLLFFTKSTRPRRTKQSLHYIIANEKSAVTHHHRTAFRLGNIITSCDSTNPSAASITASEDFSFFHHVDTARRPHPPVCIFLHLPNPITTHNTSSGFLLSGTLFPFSYPRHIRFFSLYIALHVLSVRFLNVIVLITSRWLQLRTIAALFSNYSSFVQ